MLAWFWLTPIVYPVTVVRDRLAEEGLLWLFKLYMANPMTAVVVATQRAIYNHLGGDHRQPRRQVLPAGGYGFYLQWLGWPPPSRRRCGVRAWTFRRLQADFAEEPSGRPDDRRRGRQALPAPPQAGHQHKSGCCYRQSSSEEFWPRATSTSRSARRPDRRADRPQRLGQVDPAEGAVGHPGPDHRHGHGSGGGSRRCWSRGPPTASLTGRENVPTNAAILGLTRRETERYFDDIVAFAELEPFIDNQVKHYSSGPACARLRRGRPRQPRHPAGRRGPGRRRVVPYASAWTRSASSSSAAARSCS